MKKKRIVSKVPDTNPLPTVKPNGFSIQLGLDKVFYLSETDLKFI
jgi:hypothetical protein